MKPPKEKSLELIKKFYPRCTSYSSDRKNQKENAKQCALIAVDEIIQNNYELLDGMKYHEELNYWDAVKLEIKTQQE